MILDVVHVFLFQGAFSTAIAEGQLVVVLIILLVVLLVSHVFASSFTRFIYILIEFTLVSTLCDIDKQEESFFYSFPSSDICSQRRDKQSALDGRRQMRSACNSHDGVSRTVKSTFPKRNFYGTHKAKEKAKIESSQSHQALAMKSKISNGKMKWNFAQDGGEKKFAEPKNFCLSFPHNSSSALWTMDWPRWLIQYATST